MERGNECRKCGVLLTDKNWYKSFQNKNYYICKDCAGNRRKKNKISRKEKKENDQLNQVTQVGESDVRVHTGMTFLSQVIDAILGCLGVIINAESGHGKSYLTFSLVKEAMKRDDITVIVFSPSTIWFRKFGDIDCVKVGTADYNPVIRKPKTEFERVNFLRDTIFINLDKKWLFIEDNWINRLLKSKRSLLFEIKYKNGRRIKHFESQILSKIYDYQEEQIEKDDDYNHHYIIVFEELQNSFGSYSMNTDTSLELMTIFTQSRTDANIHYVGIGQRLSDITTKVVERLRPIIGQILGENALRKIRSQLPKELKKTVQSMPKRRWLYLNGDDNPFFDSPFYKRDKKINLLHHPPPPELSPDYSPRVEKIKHQIRVIDSFVRKKIRGLLGQDREKQVKITKYFTKKKEKKNIIEEEDDEYEPELDEGIPFEDEMDEALNENEIPVYEDEEDDF